MCFREAAEAAQRDCMLMMASRDLVDNFKVDRQMAEKWRDVENNAELSPIYKRHGMWRKEEKQAKDDVVRVWAHYLSNLSGQRMGEHAILAIGEIFLLLRESDFTAPDTTLEEAVDTLCEIKKVCRRTCM